MIEKELKNSISELFYKDWRETYIYVINLVIKNNVTNLMNQSSAGKHATDVNRGKINIEIDVYQFSMRLSLILNFVITSK